jgi:DNA-binding GntR family transcriptional regulator
VPTLRGVTPVERPASLSRSAYLRMRQAIRDRALVHGTLYSENEIAATLGMSRTPVREALITLAREGLVEISSQRGFRLRELSEVQRHEVFDLRALLESYSAERLARNATPEHVARLYELVERQAQLHDDPEAFLATDEEFHLLIPTMVGLERTHDTLTSLRGAMWLIGSQALALPQRIPAVLTEHRAIVDAIAAGDPAAAARAAREHIDRTAAAVR